MADERVRPRAIEAVGSDAEPLDGRVHSVDDEADRFGVQVDIDVFDVSAVRRREDSRTVAVRALQDNSRVTENGRAVVEADTALIDERLIERAVDNDEAVLNR
ncbi:hypothetical protein [Halegenticoccus soli]|uniref:hypothetical protein n=1 Tax=Halegenticoccus soli TaxID=1985678 RepID=UPI00117AFE56|nr:hypothetical protein [Halegenticoccus soli]